VPSGPALATEEGEEQAQHDADNDAGGDREIKRGVAAFDANVTRQLAEPIAEAEREEKPHGDDNNTKNNEEFT
jgi:hypothetical protein